MKAESLLERKHYFYHDSDGSQYSTYPKPELNAMYDMKLRVLLTRLSISVLVNYRERVEIRKEYKLCSTTGQII